MSYHFVASNEFDQHWKNYVGSVENKHISLRHWVKMYEFFIVFEKCDKEETFNTVCLSP